MRVIVCGGRDFADADWLFATLDHLHRRRPITLVRQGGQMARHPDDAALPAQKQRRIGADYLAKRWAISRMIDNEEVKADWGRLGAAAGPIRNGMMIRENDVDCVIAFPRADGSIGDGTADMLKKARDAGIKTIEVVRRPDLVELRNAEPAAVPPPPSPKAPERAIPLAEAAKPAAEPPVDPQMSLI